MIGEMRGPPSSSKVLQNLRQSMAISPRRAKHLLSFHVRGYVLICPERWWPIVNTPQKPRRTVFNLFIFWGPLGRGVVMLIRFFLGINEHGRTVNQNFYPNLHPSFPYAFGGKANVHPRVITILVGGFQASRYPSARQESMSHRFVWAYRRSAMAMLLGNYIYHLVI